jgi:hypothetical protein
MYIDEISHVAAADPASAWATADNYNPDHPFPAIDHVTIAVAVDDTTPREPIASSSHAG